GPTRVAHLRAATGVERAGSILQKNYYGWFQRIKIGTYALTPAGTRALEQYAHVLGAAAADEGGDTGATAAADRPS
ncbi:MAG TPA: DUF2161 family putative PD-(D/E)XK-type phosphodiesterase, partial [Limnochordia bacterium]|nr:DUF2161 family putative PD-(D/E)XK-type phosphodiesterase [Limnochordia bacterium]